MASGVGGTYVYVMSIGYGWLWFIPLGPTRTSIGFITSAEHFKASGKTPVTAEPLLLKLNADLACFKVTLCQPAGAFRPRTSYMFEASDPG